jgi:myo-inositol 2-dehydrogenase/D-chiro-inositol 1-dehydrogenase
MPERVRVGLIGAGRIGRRHAQVLAFQIPECELVVVADAVEAAAKSTAEAARVQRWTTDPDAVMSDPSVQAVVIASSTETHAPLIVAAAQSSKDTFCEKPIALDLETTDTALDAVERAGVRLQVGFQRRFDKGYRKAKEMIAAGRLGRIEMIRDAMRDPQPASREYLASSGGLYRDMTIHNFDCVRWLMGSEPVEIFAMAATLVDPMIDELGDVDTSIVSIRFDSGGLAVIDNSRRAGFGYDVRTEIFGSEGALFVGYSRETPILHLTPQGVTSDHIHWFLDRFADAYEDELREFIASIVEGRRPVISGADGRAALVMAYGAEASRREGQAVRLDRFARKDSP